MLVNKCIIFDSTYFMTTLFYQGNGKVKRFAQNTFHFVLYILYYIYCVIYIRISITKIAYLNYILKLYFQKTWKYYNSTFLVIFDIHLSSFVFLPLVLRMQNGRQLPFHFWRLTCVLTRFRLVSKIKIFWVNLYFWIHFDFWVNCYSWQTFRLAKFRILIFPKKMIL